MLSALSYIAASEWVVARDSALGQEAFSGTWSAFVGTDDPPTRLKLVIDAAGNATLSVIDQGELAIGHLQVLPPRLRFDIDKPPISYEGTLSGSDRIVGVCHRGNQDIPLVFVRGDLYTEPPEVVFPNAPLTATRLHELRLMARAPAMGVAWQHANEKMHVLVDGRRAVDSPVAVEPSDQWHLGSVTKSFTATLVARLIEAGVLAWHSTLGEVLGPQISDMLPAYREVTVLHLLSHHGGLPRDQEGEFNATDMHASRLAYAREALQQPPSAPLGTQMSYSNADYVVAALMLETLTGKPWERLITDYVFVPLHLPSAGFGSPGLPGHLDQPVGHMMGATGLHPDRADIPAVMAPAGRVHMRLGDLLVYLEAHRDMPKYFLSEGSWSTLHTPPFGGDYALGWSVSPTGVLSHGGTNGRWKSEVLVDSAARLACASVANVLNNNTQSALRQLLAAARRSA
ncbi:MAG: serine hydrolase domain-containing protein [Steroidobacteraceae bacterium]